MGTKLAAYFAVAEEIGGLEAKIKLAVMTRVTSSDAAAAEDSPANVQAFDLAISRVRSLYGVPDAAPAAAAVPTPSAGLRVRPSLPGGEDLLFGLLGSLHDAMVAVYDSSGSCLLASESKLLAQRYGQAGLKVGEELARLVAREVGLGISQQFITPRTIVGEHKLRLGGLEVWMQVALSAVHDTSGRVTAVAAFIQDVTERRRAEDRLRDSEKRLREHNRIFLELMAQKASFLPDLRRTLARITEAAAKTIGVARASVWFYDEGKTKIVCADLYEKASFKHSAGVELPASAFPSYFRALLDQRTIAAHDAHKDPRTAEFSESYLTPLGIGAMLDVPIWVHGDMVGVVCHEHVGPAREWTADEENFAYVMGNIVALAKERA